MKHGLKLLLESHKKALPISVTYLTNNNSQTLWTMMVCPPESQKSDESSNSQSQIQKYWHIGVHILERF